jgi:hypothetical protein
MLLVYDVVFSGAVDVPTFAALSLGYFFGNPTYVG